MLLAELRQAIAVVESVAAGLDASVLGPDESAHTVELCAQGERLLAGLRLAAGLRAQETSAWRASGHRSAAEWLAASAGIGFGQAARGLETAKRLRDLPATAAAVRAGRLSEAQADQIASAAAAHPAAEQRLLDGAAYQTLRQLRQACERVRDAARPEDRAGAEERAFAERRVRHVRGRDGVDHLSVRGTPLGVARLLAALDTRAQVFFEAARRAGRRQPYGAYLYDALISLADGLSEAESHGPRAVVAVRVDAAALGRGFTGADETCEIPGVGTVSVALARSVLGDAYWALLVRDATDVHSLVTGGHTVTERQRLALAERDPVCVVAGCDMALGLEHHHWAADYATLGRTTVDEVCRVCAWHHHQLTYGHARLTRRPDGSWDYRVVERRPAEPAAA